MSASANRSDPFLAFCFAIRVDQQELGGFSECSGLQFETETQPYNEGGVNSYVLKLPTRTTQANLTLKRGIVDRKLWDWCWDEIEGQHTLRTVGLEIYDPADHSVVAAWEFYDAYPCKWIGPQLNATQASVAFETLEICFRTAKRVT